MTVWEEMEGTIIFILFVCVLSWDLKKFMTLLIVVCKRCALLCQNGNVSHEALHSDYSIRVYLFAHGHSFPRHLKTHTSQ